MGPLARIAEAEAKKNYHGDTPSSIGNLHLLRDYFAPEEVSMESLNRDWSGAFAYHCARLAGVRLPPRYPDPRVHAGFERVSSWYEYAVLPKIHLWHGPGEPMGEGDFVLFRLSQEHPMLIGIVLSVREGGMELAVGDYHNHSAVVDRPLDELVAGFLRISELPS